MFDPNKLLPILESYKQEFNEGWWQAERYKWVAVRHFQDNWNINALDFTAMFEQATAKTDNLLASSYFYPRRMISFFSEKEPETVRAMFINLFDETQELEVRIETFKTEAAKLKEKYVDENKQDFQTENAISTYLWLMFPDKYYIYKYGIYHRTATELNSDFVPKSGAGAINVVEGYKLYDKITEVLAADQELIAMFQSVLDEECYSDPKYRTLAIDVGYYLFSLKKRKTWLPSTLKQAITTEEWLKLLKDKSIFNDSSLEIMARMKDIGGEATCTQLAEKYGGTPNLYNSGSSSLARRIAKKMDLEKVMTSKKNEKWWPILYRGRYADNDEKGVFVWKLRDELSKALDQMDLSDVQLYVINSDVTEENSPELYSKEDFLNEVYIEEQSFDTLSALLQRKKNLIVQGPPGVGKTFMAKRLAYALMEEKDESRIEFIQFHQNYSYEDFVMGYKPVDEGFELRHGIFFEFCEKALNDPGRDYFFIIDEINRGNLSKIFGELLMLIEADYRDTTATLAYNGLPFSVPENLYLLGLMNTADRSLAMIDYALRRRFSFFNLSPGFNSEGFRTYQKGIGDAVLDELIEKIKELNREISEDSSLGEGFAIGHSYFCGLDQLSDGEISDLVYEIIEYDLLPMLAEYWFDDSAKLKRWENILRGVLSG